MFDLLVRGGDLIDGTGGGRRRADVGVVGDRVVAIGDLGGDAAQVIDAGGRVVAPGFVDVHTHFDAQVFWDGALTPSPFHGVTTALAGNCGFTIAPLSGQAADGEYLLRMLARVEGMPLQSLREGVPWDWRTTAEYLDRVEPLLGINAGFMVGHSAIRRRVMGVEATGRTATPDELDAMRRLLHAGLEAGAIGFSSSWARTHNDAEGAMVPSRYGTAEELLALARVAGEHPGTSLEFIPMVGPFEPWAIDLMAGMSAAAGRPLNWNILTVGNNMTDEAVEAKLAAGDVARQRGGRVVALTMPMGIGTRLTFVSGFVLDAMPGWDAFIGLPPAERLARLADPGARAELDRLAQSEENPVRGVADWASKVIFDVVAPENAGLVGRTVGEIAAERGRAPWDTLCDIVVADELKTSFGTPEPVLSRDEWARRMDVVRDDRALMGASDAGAHLDLLATFNFPTVVLAEAVRRHRVMSLEEAVHHLTQKPAALYGLRGRGTVAEGNYADLVVFDPETVASHPVAMRYDLPGGAGRLYAEADGIDHVVVNGVEIVEGGKLTGATAGTLLRSGRDTENPDLG